MEQGIINNIVSKEVEEQLKRLEIALTNIEKSIRLINSSKSGKVNVADVQAAVTAETKLAEAKVKTASAAQAKAKVTIEEKVATASLTNIQKLNAIAASSQVSAFERLVAAQKLAAMAAQEAGLKFGLESTQFQQASLHSTKLAGNLSKLSQASGNMGRAGMNNAYNSTFQLTQVMRELPNFAIDARIGFMSLSNNLPMLADGFKQLSNSVDAAGNKLGNAGAWKVMLKSLLSLNTIMIVAVTLMTLFGDKIVNWIGSLFKGNRALDESTIRTKAFNKVLKDGGGTIASSIGKMQELKSALDKASNGTYDADKAVKMYNESLGKNYGKVNDLSGALAGYVQNSNSYVKSAISRAAADTIAADAAVSAIKRQSAEQKLATMAEKDPAGIGLMEMRYKRIKDIMSQIPDGQKILAKSLKNLDDITSDKNFFQKSIDGLSKYGIQMKQVRGILIEIAKDDKGKSFLAKKEDIEQSTVEMDAYQKVISSFFTDLDFGYNQKDITAKVVQTAKDISISRDYYDHKRGEIVEELAKIELRANKETESGVLNSYENRTEAIGQYYLITKELATSDLTVAIATAMQKSALDKQRIESERARNKELYDKKKITLDDYNKSEQEHAVASEAIDKNLSDSLSESHDKYNKSIYDGERKLSADLYKVRVDRYSDEVKLLDVSLKAQDKLVEQYKRKQKIEIENNSVVDMLFEALGYQKDIALETLAMEHDANLESLQNKLGTVNLKLSAVEKGSDAERLILLEKKDFEKQIEDEISDYSIKTAEQVAAKKKSLQEDIEKSLTKALGSLWESYWRIQDQNLDKQSKKDDTYYKAQLDDNQEMYDNKIINEETYSGNKKDIQDAQIASEDEIEKKRVENEKNKFLMEQTVALSKIVFSTALGVMEYASNPLTAALVPWIIALGATQSAAIIAQSIPYFEHGGVTDKDGNIIVNEKRRELVVEPSGKAYVPQTDGATMLNVPKGTTIFPDASTIANDTITRMLMLNTGSTTDVSGLRKDLHVLTEEVKKLKAAPSKEPSLYEQIQTAKRLKLN